MSFKSGYTTLESKYKIAYGIKMSKIKSDIKIGDIVYYAVYGAEPKDALRLKPGTIVGLNGDVFEVRAGVSNKVLYRKADELASLRHFQEDMAVFTTKPKITKKG